MTDRPLCACHDEPMEWNKSGRYRAGGFWRCRIKNRESTKRGYWADPDKARRQIYEHRRKLVEQGLCRNGCGEPLLSEVLCWGCLNKQGRWTGWREPATTQDETPNTQLVRLSA